MNEQQIAYQQVQTPVTSDEIYGTQIQQEVVRNIVSQISPDSQLYEIEMRIRGYRKDINNNKWVKINGAVEPDNMLVGRYISYLSSLMNQNTSLSNLSSLQINKIMKMAIEWIADDLDANGVGYGLGSDYTERTRIANQILNPLFLVLSRALNGMESRRIWNSVNLSESMAGGQLPQQKKSFWSNFNFMK